MRNLSCGCEQGHNCTMVSACRARLIADEEQDELRAEVERQRQYAVRLRDDRDRLRAALDRVLPWIDARRLTPEDDAVADAVRAALAGSAPAPATTTTYTVPGPYAPIQTSGYSQPDWPTMRPVAPAEAAPEITQLCPKCTTGWTARELLPCPECGYTFPSRPDDAPETEEMRLLTALVSVRPGCATFDRLMREATAFIAREKLQDDCQHCGGHPGGLDGKGTPCPACGSPGLHRSDCAANNGPALPLGECDCQPMAKAFIEDVRRSRWLDNSHVRCQADCRDECRFPKCRCPLRHTRDCDKTLLPGNDRALCTCGADANNQGREIRVNADGSEYQPPPAPAPEPHMHRWVRSSMIGQDTCLDCHRYRPTPSGPQPCACPDASEGFHLNDCAWLRARHAL